MIIHRTVALLSFCLAASATALPETMLLILNKGDGTLSMVDPASLQVLATVPAGKEPHEVIASADGKLAFASNYGKGHTLSVVDLVDGKAMKPVELGALVSPHGLARADGKIYFTAEGSKVIGRCDPDTREVDWILGTGQDKTHMIRLSDDGKTIVTTNIGSGNISIASERNNDWHIANVAVGKGPEGFDITPDGRQIWVANSQDGTISIVDAAKKETVKSIAIGTKRSNRLEFMPDGKTVLVSDLAGTDLVVIDAAGGEVKRRVDLGGGAAGIRIQPDGAKAYVALPGKNEVVVIDAQTWEIAGRIATGRGPDGMAWVVRD